MDLRCAQFDRDVSSYLLLPQQAVPSFIQAGAPLGQASWVKWHRFFRIRRCPVLISATLVVLVEVWYRVIQEALTLAQITLSLSKPGTLTGFYRRFGELAASVFITNSSPMRRHKPVILARCKSPVSMQYSYVWITLYLALRHGYFPVCTLTNNTEIRRCSLSGCRHKTKKYTDPLCQDSNPGSAWGLYWTWNWVTRVLVKVTWSGWMGASRRLPIILLYLQSRRTIVLVSWVTVAGNVFLFGSERHMTQLLVSGGLVVS
jgi:hypothetical protein